MDFKEAILKKVTEITGSDKDVSKIKDNLDLIIRRIELQKEKITVDKLSPIIKDLSERTFDLLKDFATENDLDNTMALQTLEIIIFTCTNGMLVNYVKNFKNIYQKECGISKIPEEIIDAYADHIRTAIGRLTTAVMEEIYKKD